MLLSFLYTLRAVASSSKANAVASKGTAPRCRDVLTRFECQDLDDIPHLVDQQSGALLCLVVELGHATRAGWAPTLRWISLLLALATGAALVMAVWK
jgi:hypothetical protein